MSHDLKLERLFGALPEVYSASSPASRPQRELYTDAPDRIAEPECELRGWGQADDRVRASANPAGSQDQVFQGVDWGRGAWSIGRR
jgi:hypothetical protein